MNPLESQRGQDRRIIYNRTGNLSQTTQLNEEIADKFMSRSKIKKDIFIKDSDKLPEGNSVKVGSDTLAFRFLPTIDSLTSLVKETPLYSLSKVGRSFEIKVHERVIDQKIRSNHPLDSSDYKEKFLKSLNKAICQGLGDALTQEKLGVKDQIINYSLMAGIMMDPILNFANIYSHPLESLMTYPVSIFLANCSFNAFYYYVNHNFGITQRPDVKDHKWEIVLPCLPVDKWILGKDLLLRQGKKLIIEKEILK